MTGTWNRERGAVLWSAPPTPKGGNTNPKHDKLSQHTVASDTPRVCQPL